MQKITAQTPIHVFGYGYMTLELLEHEIKLRINQMARFAAEGDYGNVEYVRNNLEPLTKAAKAVKCQMEAA